MIGSKHGAEAGESPLTRERLVGERCKRIEAGAEASVDCLQAIMRT